MGETLAAELLGASSRRRTAWRAARREFRARRPVAAFVAAVLLTAAGGIAASEIVARRSGRYVIPRGWSAAVTAWLHDTPWSHPAVAGTGVAAAAVGLWLLLSALLPGRGGLEPLRGADDRTAAALSREALRRALLHAALSVPGVARAEVRVGSRVHVRVVPAREVANHDGNTVEFRVPPPYGDALSAGPAEPGGPGGFGWFGDDLYRTVPGSGRAAGDVSQEWLSGGEGGSWSLGERVQWAVEARLAGIGPVRRRRVTVRVGRRR